MELNKPYKSSEIAEGIFHVSTKTFQNKRKIYEAKLSECYDWKYEKKRYVLLKEKKEYVAPKKKSRFEIQQEIRAPLHKIINQYPLQTYTTLSKKMEVVQDPFVKEHPQTVKTRAEYAKVVVDIDYGVEEWLWGHIDGADITPITNEQITFLKSLAKKKKGYDMRDINIMLQGLVESGFIDEQVAKDLYWEVGKADYEHIMYSFEAKYHFRPQLVPKLKEGMAWEYPYLLPYRWTGEKDMDKLEQIYPNAIKMDFDKVSQEESEEYVNKKTIN